VPEHETPTAFGIGGVGGGFAGADRATGIAFAVTKNRLRNDFQTATEIIGLVYRLSQEDRREELVSRESS
jgi:hypothetical protein